MMEARNNKANNVPQADFAHKTLDKVQDGAGVGGQKHEIDILFEEYERIKEAERRSEA